MNLAEKIALISIEYTQDDLGQWIETRTKSEVFGIVDSVTMNEFYQAGMQGFKPEYRILVWMTEYSGEEILEYKDKIYQIYRSYRRDDGRIELYVTERKGDEEDDSE
ncbi:MAG: phage head closure protein [Clostridiales bacterium]|nr:phage head closure protein [Clostridiales bacterium]